jgi:hypothetical protein
LLEDHVQPLIGKVRKWRCDASLTFKYWDMFLVAVQIMLSNVRAERESEYHHHLKFEQTTFKSQKNKDTSTNTKEINP